MKAAAKFAKTAELGLHSDLRLPSLLVRLLCVFWGEEEEEGRVLYKLMHFNTFAL